MFSELPKLFDRDFAVGFLLPAAGFVIANLVLKALFSLFPHLVLLKANDLAFNTGTVGLASLLMAILLLVLNWEAYRLLEGYGQLNPFRLLAKFQQWKFKRLHTQFDVVKAALAKGDTAKKPGEHTALRTKRNELGLVLAQEFPDSEDKLQPTAFGNAIRAFEVYPRIMYGLDGVTGWDRLLAVIPEDYRKLVNAAKASVDFWVNAWLLSVVVLFEYAGCAMKAHHTPAVWLPLLSAACCLLASIRAKSAAIGWGAAVKSSFDVFLPELRKKLAFVEPKTLEEERAFWKRFSGAITYRLPDSLDDRNSAQATDSKAPLSQAVPVVRQPEDQPGQNTSLPLLSSENQSAFATPKAPKGAANPGKFTSQPDSPGNNVIRAHDASRSNSQDTATMEVSTLYVTEPPDETPSHVPPTDISRYTAGNAKAQIAAEEHVVDTGY